jgi:SAM-dependent methyltransferase
MPWFTGRRRSTEVPEEISSPVSSLLPHSDQEQQRLFFQHYMMRTILGGNIAAPLSYVPSTVVDIGCGTGQWALEVAYEMPAAKVVGIDLTLPRVDRSHPHYPRNCLFERLNALEPLPFAPQSIDYLHLRFMSSSIPLATWPQVIPRLVSYVKIGGWVEWVESGPIYAAGPAFSQLCSAWDEFGRRRGHLARPGPQIAQALQAAGLIDVAYQPVQVPVGVYGGRLGKMTTQDAVAIFRALRPGILQFQIMTPQEFDWCIEQMQVEMNDPRSSLQTTWEIAIACGQREGLS